MVIRIVKDNTRANPAARRVPIFKFFMIVEWLALLPCGNESLTQKFIHC
jgi:hypothetical protein